MPSIFARRRLVPELMDQPGLEKSQHVHALQFLERVNWVSGSAGLLWPAIRRAAGQVRDRPLRVLDVACGGGDVLTSLWRKAQRAGLSLDLSGCDVSPVALEHARLRALSAGASVRFFQQNVLMDTEGRRGERENGRKGEEEDEGAVPISPSPPLPFSPGSFDVVTCSLFLHHLTDADVLRTMKNMARAAGRLLLINDLRRSRLNWWTTWVATRLLTTSYVVRFDGPVSVAAAFTCAEMRHMAQQAGLTGASIQRRWPCRMLLTWWKPTEVR